MPEGDTIHKVARVLGPVLAGQPLERVWLRKGGAGLLRGRRVVRVRALGKHLLFSLEARTGHPDTLRVHLGMPGSWHLYPAGGRPKRSRRAVVVLLGTARHDAVCFHAPQVELGDEARMHQTGALSLLGPDVLGPNFCAHDAARRARVPRSLGEVLLDQSVVCGLGNVYRNELCFVAGVHPGTLAVALSEEELRRTFVQARRWLEDNLGPWMRVTRGPPPGPRRGEGDRHWVYGREGRPCLRCGTRIHRFQQGAPARVAFACPRCQPLRQQGDLASAPVEPSSVP